MSSNGTASRRTKRHTWAFNSSRAAHDGESELSREEQVSFVDLPLGDSRSSSSRPVSRRRELNVTEQSRPRSAGSASVSDRRCSSLTRVTSNKSRGLPTILEKKHIEIASMLPNRTAAPIVKRWDARTRTTSPWDGLRRDSELFYQRGNCSIHFYGKGQSRRGPSLRIALDRIYAARFESLFSIFHTEVTHSDLGSEYDCCDVYIPSPEDASRSEAFTWHLTTRNFFAFVLGRPIVGSSLARSLIDLRDRLDVFRPGDDSNDEDMLEYLETAGYLDLAHAPDYSLALLNYAENFQMRDLWVDAFVHCVGMNEMLVSSTEFNYVSYVTHALITRAYLEMDLHLGRVTRSLSNFLEEDLNSSNFGISSGARTHLDRFRTFLHEHYVQKFGYWPPPKGSHFSKSLYKSMYFDFRTLYDYLVDLESSHSLAAQPPASGGICVLQNIKAFDERHRLVPLPHPHPLLPKEPMSWTPITYQRQRIGLKRGPKSHNPFENASSIAALRMASNQTDAAVVNAPLVKAYQKFEQDCLSQVEDKISLSDARKVRWVLIYGTLQMLVSVIRAPKEVRITETSYPLCCLVTGTPPWESGTKALQAERSPSINMHPMESNKITLYSLEPDCKSEDFLPSELTASPAKEQPGRRHVSVPLSMESVGGSPRRSSLLRNASIRSVKTLSTSIGSIRSASRKSATTKRQITVKQTTLSQVPYTTTTTAKPTKANFCEIVIHGYGNGLQGTHPEEAQQARIASELSEEVLPEIVVPAAQEVSSIVQNLEQKAEEQAIENQIVNAPPPLQPRSPKRLQTVQDLALQLPHTEVSTAIPEPTRTPLMDVFTEDQSLPGIDTSHITNQSSASSIYSTSSASADPDTPASCSDSRKSSASSSSSTNEQDSEEKHDKSDFIIEQKSLRPMSLTRAFSAPELENEGISTPISATTNPAKSSTDLPMVVDIEELRVYRPTGVPSILMPNEAGEEEDDEEEFPTREGNKRWSVASRTHSIGVNMPSLRRRKDVSGARRSGFGMFY